jgi:hypothetical protein
VLRVRHVPESDSVYVLDGDSEVFLGVKGTRTSVVSELVPTVVDELDRFEGVVRCEVLGNVVPSVRSVPLDGPFYVGWEIVVGSAGDGSGLVVWSKSDL